MKAMLAMAIAACRKAGKYAGICGQGPSDHPDLAQWLVDAGHREHVAQSRYGRRDVAAARRQDAGVNLALSARSSRPIDRMRARVAQWQAMNLPPRLRVELAPVADRRRARSLAARPRWRRSCWSLPLDPWCGGGDAARDRAASRFARFVALSDVPSRRCSTSAAIAGSRRHARRPIARAARILDDSYVGARLTTIVWRPDGAPLVMPVRAIVILPDTLAADDFRRLRVLLRYGQPGDDEDASERDAG